MTSLLLTKAELLAAIDAAPDDATVIISPDGTLRLPWLIPAAPPHSFVKYIPAKPARRM